MPLEELLRREDENLAPYAFKNAQSRGREHPLEPDPFRSDFQRDRDRIIHCAAFRKLEYKTQVYVIHENDYYRTRITHTLEVSQIARTLARCLGLNVDLAEAISLAHDLGHPPFGHAGERALQRLLADAGGFEHNEQALRIVERLEERFPQHPGLNLTYELREGIIKHETVYDTPAVDRFDPDVAPFLESQIVNCADEIAFNNHDLDDALKLELIALDDLAEVPWVHDVFEATHRKLGPGTREKFIVYKSIGHIIGMQVGDVLDEARRVLREERIETLDDVRKHAGRIVQFSAAMQEQNAQLRDFLYRRVYRSPFVVRMATKAERFVTELFNLYEEVPELLPLKHQERAKEENLKHVIRDYLSGMTDRYLQEEYIRVFEPQVLTKF